MWHSRGYLPHFEDCHVVQHVTIHLADSLPKTVLDQFSYELQRIPPERHDIERRRKIEAWLDAGHGSCILREPEIAGMVQNSLLFFDKQRYRLLAWVVMPNHIHTLFQPMAEWTVARIVASWKKFTASRIKEFRRGCGHTDNPIEDTSCFATQASGVPGTPRIWHREYWDRYIRNEQHFRQTIEYIHQNPVKARLSAKPEDWPWSSAFPGNTTLLNDNA